MKMPVKFREFIWLVDAIRSARRITFSALQRRWINSPISDGEHLVRSTFNRHRDSVREIFGIDIKCDLGTNEYYIGNPHVLRSGSVQNWMFSTLAVSNIISESLSLQDRIFLEIIPADIHLRPIVEAMKNGNRIILNYCKYGSSELSEKKIDPYCLKVYQRRWYVLGRTQSGHYVTYSFDRIQGLTVTDEKFTIPKNFNPKAYYRDCYGVMRDETKPCQRIVLRAYGIQANYLEDLPIHSSQRKLKDGDGYTDYEYMLRPSSDFMGYLMGRGDWLQIISPQSLADELRQLHENAMRLYDKDTSSR